MTEVGSMLASSVQRYYWYRFLDDPDPVSQAASTAVEIEGACDLDALARAMAAFVDAHEIFRTRLVARGDEVLQVVAPLDEARFALEIVQREGPIDLLHEATELARELDLPRGRVLRARVIRLASERSVLVVAAHRAATDCDATRLLLRRTFELYATVKAGDVPVETPRAQYSAATRAIETWESSADAAARWDAYLAGARAVDVPVDHVRDRVDARREASRTGITADPCYPFEVATLTSDDREAIPTFARRARCPVHNIYLAAYVWLLHRECPQREICIESATNIRGEFPALAEVQGVLTGNTIARVDLAGCATFRDAVEAVNRTIGQTRLLGSVPNYYTVVPHGIRRVHFNYIATRWAPRLPRSIGGLGLVQRTIPDPPLKRPRDLFLTVDDADAVTITMTANADLFEHETVPRLLSAYIEVLLAGVREALPTAAAADVAPARSPYVAPRTEDEIAIAELFADVLGIERVGIRDDFVAAGGDSLLATRLVARVYARLAIELPLRTVFEAPTVEGLARALGAARTRTRDAKRATIGSVKRVPGAPVPLTHAQKRIWFLQQLEPDSVAYHTALGRQIHGPLDVEVLRAAVDDVVDRHESLRTYFPSPGGEPAQEVRPHRRWELPISDLSALAPAARHQAVERIATEVFDRPFDLESDLLVRTRLVRLGPEEHLFLAVVHHVVSDGWSMGVLWREVAERYAARIAGRTEPAPDLPIQYADFATWHSAWFDDQELDRQLQYWTDQLRGAPDELALPLATERPQVLGSRGIGIKFELDAALSEKLRALARRQGATLFMALTAAFRALLARYTGQSDIVIGTPIANRNRREVEGLIGLFVNTLALRCDVRADDTFSTLLAREKTVALAAYEHQETPFELIVDKLNIPRRLNRNPVFQVWCVHDKFHAETTSLGAAWVELMPRPDESSKFDLACYSADVDGTIRFRIQVNADLFDAATIEHLAVNFRELLEQVTATTAVPIRDIAMRTPSSAAVATTASTVEDATIWDRFVAEVVRDGQRTAVRDPVRVWSYAELHARAGAIAAQLDDADAGERVTCMFAHGGEMVAGILGVLAGGRAYVPLDPMHPAERQLYIHTDSGASAIVCDASSAARATELAASAGSPVVRADTAIASGRTPRRTPRPDQLAYCLYTSGSTGRPKGVLQSHAHVVRFIDAYRRLLAIQPTDVLTLVSTFGFDAAVVDVFSALLSGATLVTRDLREHGFADFAPFLADHKVTIFHSTPTVFRELTALLAAAGTVLPAHVRAATLGGEKVVAEDVARFRDVFPPAAVLVNGYGMTECTWASFETIGRDQTLTRRTVPLGHAIDDVAVTLETPLGRQVAIYGVGELVIESAHVALGYWNRPAETAAAFRPAPGGGRVYRTGDLARRLPDGRFEYVGRADSQVKIRGVRIELGEIESVVAGCPEVAACAAVVRAGSDGEPRLVAFAVRAADITATELAARIATRLPRSMVPSAIVFVPELPRTPTGKVDRRALPAPDETAVDAAAGAEAPAGDLEQALAAIWTEVLGVSSVGRHDDFFDLGGHSLSATRVVSRVRERLGAPLTIRAMFDAPTIAELALWVRTAGN